MRALDKLCRRHLGKGFRGVGFFKMYEVLDISLWSFYRGIIEIQNAVAVPEAEVINRADNLSVNRWVADYALFADLIASRFKLRLDKADCLSVIGEELSSNGKQKLERDEAYVNREEINLIGDELLGYVSHIGSLEVHDALVGSELPRELTVADVYGINLLCAVLKHTVGSRPLKLRYPL